jgi:hypothetical protein
VVQINEKEGTRLTKLDVAGGSAQPIPVTLTNMRLNHISSNSVAADGRIVVAVDSPDSWFQSAAVIDVQTGRIQKIPLNFIGDIHYPGWSKDGRIVAAGLPMRSSLWRFRPITKRFGKYKPLKRKGQSNKGADGQREGTYIALFSLDPLILCPGFASAAS